MLLKILGGFDIVAGFILIFENNFTMPWQFLWIIGILLLLKAAMGMLKDFASWIDFLSGISFLLLIIIPLPWFVELIFGVLLIQKGFISFL